MKAWSAPDEPWKAIKNWLKTPILAFGPKRETSRGAIRPGKHPERSFVTIMGIAMHLRSVARSLSSLGFLAVALCAQTPPEWKKLTTSGPWAIPEDADGLAAEIVVLVIDGSNGKPIPGATLKVIEEPGEAIADRMPRLAEGVTDSDGWTHVKLPTGAAKAADWTIIEAPGFAPRVNSGLLPDHPTVLVPGRDVEVLVRNHLDKPVAGVRIEYFQGCGHVPHLRVAISDESGRAVIPCIDPSEGEIWSVKAGYQSEYFDLSEADEGPVKISLRPTPTARGILREWDGSPAAGILVGAPNCHRGPWTLTDAQGRFELAGAEVAASVTIKRKFDDRLPALMLERGEEDCDFRVTLPKPGEDYELPSQRVDVTVRDASGPVQGILVTFVRAQDGAQFGRATDAEGQVTVDAPPGKGQWILGSPLGFHRRKVVPGEVGAETGAVSFEVERLPTFTVSADNLFGRPRTEDELWEKGDGSEEEPILAVQLMNETSVMDIKDLVRQQQPIPVPDGQSSIGILVRDSGWQHFPVAPQGSPATLPIRLITPPRDRPLEQVPEVDEPTAELRIQDAMQLPLEDVSVTVFTKKGAYAARTDEFGGLNSRPGVYQLRGAGLRIEPISETVAWYAVGDPSKQPKLTVPAGEITVEAPPGFELGSATIYVNGIPVDGHGSSWVARWLPAGRYRIIVTASGIPPYETEVTLAAGQKLTLAPPKL